jgi:hypothetical protein
VFDALSPSPPAAPTRWWAAAVGSALVGWWAFVALQLAWPPEVSGRREAQSLVIALGMALGLGRWLMYAAGYASPLSLRGRLATGRIVIPGYDKILVAPFCILLAAIAWPEVANRLSLGLPATVGIGYGMLLLLVAKLPPAFGEWKLTGHHHHRVFSRAVTAPATRAAT